MKAFLTDLQESFEAAGGCFGTSPDRLALKMRQIKALVFDWDGVFNNGVKDKAGRSSFSEIDSMGVNMLRYGLWRQKKKLPYTAVMTGEQNPMALKFVTRECFEAIYFRVKDKNRAIKHLSDTTGIKPENILYIFDDINDLAVARVCGLRFLIRRQASQLFNQYVLQNGLGDYITSQSAINHAVREVCELCLGLMSIYDEVVISRTGFDKAYQQYWRKRGLVELKQYTGMDGKIVLLNK